MARTKSKKQANGDNGALVATVVAGGLGLLIGLFALNRRRDGLAAGGSTAADLALDQPRHAPGDRAPTDFRPDATAAIDPRKRDAFAPATMPNPNAAEPAM